MILKIGSRGSEVKRLQLALLAHGYNIGHDGIFGPMTDRAVRDLQKTRGLVVDGIVGPRTWGVIAVESPPMVVETKRKQLTANALRSEYERDWSLLTIRPARAAVATRQAATLAASKAR